MIKKRGIILATLGMLIIVLAISCGGNSTAIPGPRVQEAENAPSSSPAPDDGSEQSRQWDEYWGVTRDSQGHLQIEGNTDIRPSRLLARLNEQAKTAGEESCAPYNLSGAYSVSDGLDGYQDRLRYFVQVSFDSPTSLADLAELAAERGIIVSDLGHLLLAEEDPYKQTESILAYLNAEAAHEDCKYKFRARYQQQETLPRYDLKTPDEGGVTSERLDVMVHLSSDSFIFRGSNISLPARNLESQAIVPTASIPFVYEWKRIVARAALEFAQVFSHPTAELTITTLDFIGEAPDGPNWTYVFDAVAIKELQAKRTSEDIDPIAVLALGEEKLRKLRSANPPAEPFPRDEEPINERAIKIVALLAQETARVNLNPSRGVFITVYDRLLGNRSPGRPETRPTRGRALWP